MQSPSMASKSLPTGDKESQLENARLDLAKLHGEKLVADELQALDQFPESIELQQQVKGDSILKSWHQLKQLWSKAENQKDQFEKERKLLEEKGVLLDQETKSLEARRKQYETLEAKIAEIAGRDERLRQREAEAEAGFPDRLRIHLEKIEQQRDKNLLRQAALDAKEKELDERLRTSLEDFQRNSVAKQRKLDAEHNERMRLLQEQQLKLNNKEFDLVTREKLLTEDRADLLAVASKLETAAVAAKNAEIERQEGVITEYRKLLAQSNQAILDFEKDLKALGHRSPKQTAEEFKNLRAELDRVNRELASSLSIEERARLMALHETNERLQQDLREALESKEEYRHRYEKIQYSVTQLEDQARKIKSQESTINLNRQMIEDLQKEIDGYTKKSESKKSFELCTGMDSNGVLKKERKDHHEFVSLPELTGYLRNQIATVEDARLYYSERMIQTYLAGLAIGKLTILQGISGTGKTSLPRAFAKAIGASDTASLRGTEDLLPFSIVEVQSGWRDRQDLLGYFNTFEGKYYETAFLTALYRAGSPKFKDTPFFIILDEMNLSHPEHYFADLLSQMENEEASRTLRIVATGQDLPARFVKASGGIHLPLPPNVWFIGTANHDETTLQFAPKTYDRANVMEMPIHPEKFDPKIEHPRALSYSNLNQLFQAAEKNRFQEVKEATNFLSGNIKPLVEPFGIGWGNRLEKQLSKFLPVFLDAGGTSGQALDHIVASKVLRNLKNRFDIKKDDLEKLQYQLADAFMAEESKGDAEDCMQLLEMEIRRHS